MEAGAPSPGGVRTVGELGARLRELQVWSGLSYREIHRRVVRSRQERGIAELPAFNTTYRCLSPGRTRLDVELVVDIARAVLGNESRAAEWRQAHQVVSGLAADASVVHVADRVESDEFSFIGRSSTIAAALAALETHHLVLIDGMPGVGKTSLAGRVASQVPDVELQFSVNLRGYDPARPPADPGAVLDGFLRRLGVPGSRIHGLDLSARSGLFSELVAGRRTVVLLDNAASDDQVQPLLADSALTLVTSRRRLTASPDAYRINLEVFEPSESAVLIRRAAGAAVDDEPEAAVQIAELVGHLPLALAALAGRIKAQPEWTLGDHLERLQEHTARLRLDDGVAASLSLSYQALPIQTRRLLRLLALHPGRDFDVYAAAALAGTDRESAQQHLANLVQMNLLEEHGSGRYELHDLVRLLASDQSRDEDPASVRRAALDGLFDYYRKTLATAATAYAPHDQARIELTERAGLSERQFADRDDGRAWLDLERPNLIATALYAADHGRPEYATALSAMLMYYLGTASLFTGAEVLHLTAIRCARSNYERGRSYNNLGALYWRLGRYADGRAAYQHALDYARLAGNRVGEASGLSNVALGHYRLGDYEAAIACQREAFLLFDAEGNLSGMTSALSGQGWPELRRGRPEVALKLFEEGLAISRKLGSETFEEAFALNNVAAAHEALGRLDEAWQGYEQSLELARRLSFVNSECDSLNSLGRLQVAAGRIDEALALHQQALDMAVRLGSRPFTIEVRNDYGHALSAAGRVAEAIVQHRIALEDAERIEDRYEQDRASAALSASHELT
ncbi:tetratricopeptide repeat protein [Kribbella sp. NPDC023855]|uniref:tetratricopeptide repeat protein n=1 Tax=Kribbella sp. NPDC023855 TaxID=3154698 RepID=UPI0033CEB69E